MTYWLLRKIGVSPNGSVHIREDGRVELSYEPNTAFYPPTRMVLPNAREARFLARRILQATERKRK